MLTGRVLSFAVAVALITPLLASCSGEPERPLPTGPGIAMTERGPTGVSVTFRYYAPDADSVGLIGDAYFTDPDHIASNLAHDARLGDQWRPGDVSHPLVAQPPAPLTRGADGVWELTTAMPAGTFSYGFVEGDCDRAAACAGRYDPSNPPPFADDQRAGHQRASQIFVPANPAFDSTDLAYEADARGDLAGLVSHRTYPSSQTLHPSGEHALGLYLPAGYDDARAEPYPLLILSHGMLENETAWFADGRAAQILDHAIAAGSIPPVVMVTTDFGGLSEELPGSARFHDAYVTELVDNVLPWVEQELHVSHERHDRAFAGLSMGGALGVGLLEHHPDIFGWYGLWSAAPVPEGWRVRDAHQREAIRAALGIHIGVGLHDGIAGISRSSPERAEDYRELGAEVTELNVPGAHTWQVWRAQLHHFLTTTAFRDWAPAS
ncbi:alpha/beta hydrolase-fold protein [Demequina sp. NBRC 110053]|uniref:alpha/beta hydrolase-fold protein n=1 Tax=Demequina sp. NBRC 110053 TaxID=1570342 RepID=UPI0009FD4D01|nr:alpha/beta hydrolase-fold protein [Demequina sp. NBRC 110053]